MNGLELALGLGLACAVLLELTFAFERWQHRRIRRDYTERELRRRR